MNLLNTISLNSFVFLVTNPVKCVTLRPHSNGNHLSTHRFNHLSFMSKRNIPRINYRTLHSSGRKVHSEDQISQQLANLSLEEKDMSANEEAVKNLTVLVASVNDDIEETPNTGLLTVIRTDTTISEMKMCRNKLRNLIIETKLNEDHQIIRSAYEAIASIGSYITSARDHLQKLELTHSKEATQEAARKERTMLFTIDDTQQQLSEIEAIFNQKISETEDKALTRLYNNSEKLVDRLNMISTKYEKLLQSSITDSDALFAIKRIGEQYMKLSSQKSDFKAAIHREYSKRELDKDHSMTNIKIKLDKFCGYDSPIDFYTFKSNFEKLYLQFTPTKYLPDLLKNNHLGEPAITLVQNLDNIDDIWQRLKTAFGDTKTLLTKKLQTLNKFDITKSRDPEKLVVALSKFSNIIREVMQLANKHKIEDNLYFGESLQRIYLQLGENRLTRFLSSISDDDLSPKQTWERLLTFLRKEEDLNQTKLVIIQSQRANDKKESTPQPNPPKKRSFFGSQDDHPTCQLCGEPPSSTQHTTSRGPNDSRIVQYYTCRDFAEKTPAARLSTINRKGFCVQCLLPGADSTKGKHSEGRCQRDFVCPHQSHQKYAIRKHVLLCEEHKDDQANQDVLEHFKSRFMRSSNLPDFSKQIKLSFHSAFKSDMFSSPKDSVVNKGIYLLQTITVNGKRLNVFYDNGCSDFIMSTKAVHLLGPSAVKLSSEPINLSGVGNSMTVSSGAYSVTLPLHDGKKITLSGICLDQITSKFPIYPLREVEKDITNHYESSGGTVALPKLPPVVGGDVHLMIGVKYLRYHPKLVHQLESGLSIYESAFNNSDGGRGVVGGPHKTFTEINNSFYSSSNSTAFFSMGRRYSSIEPSVLGYREDQQVFLNDEKCTEVHLTHQQRLFEQVESTGCEVSYRCPTCRTCKDCKHFDEYQSISLKEELEQSIINTSVTIDRDNCTTSASLPFIASPSRLARNKDRAMKVYKQQLRKLNNPSNIKDKEDILESERKLQQLNYVEYIENLPHDVQDSLKSHPIQNFIPWRAVWKENSVSTPCRIVFDASQATSSGYSLNDLLAKGRNNLNKLQEIVIRWSMHRVGIHTDVRKMYNTIQLNRLDWCYQRYIWEENLDPTKIPKEKVIKTLIYGVRSSGNQSEYALRKVAELSQSEHPDVNRVVQEDIYVDDCITGATSITHAHDLADKLELVINKGGFQLKGVSFSGETPLEKLTDDGETIHVAGMRWFPKDDTLALNISELNFAKKCRGKKPSSTVKIIPPKLTRRHCSSKVAEIFDITGKVTPLVAAMKMDLQELVQRKLDWDDKIPDEFRSLWESHFDMIQEINNLRYQRVIVPEDAINLEIDTIDFGDASKLMVCSCIYARFKRNSGNSSCQLVLARSRVVPKGMSLPRAELYAALLNTYTGEIARRSFKKYHKNAIKLTDNTACLFWITNDEKPLDQWIRNRVIEVLRFTSVSQWFYVNSEDNLAYIGTRRGVSIKDVDASSKWFNGLPWMQLDYSEFPIMNPDEVRLNVSSSEVESHTSKVDDVVKDYYAFSDYLMDPNRHSFKKVVKIIAYVIRFCHNIRRRIQNQDLMNRPYFSDDEIKNAEKYFFKVGTKEVFQFVQPKKFEKITQEKNGILHYTGRILPSDKVSIVGKFTSTMKDLSTDTFCVPVLSNHSPIAYSIALDFHWNHPVCQHTGVESTIRYLMKKVYIIECRPLIKLIRKSCQRCRFLMKKSVEVVMGPISDSNLTIAPAFYASQIDLSGPYSSFSPNHKRTTVKVWLIIICCCTTSACSINVMDDYSADSFILSFTRFACNHGYPKKLYCDGGSQLIKGCNSMKLDFVDLQSKLHQNKGVEFSVCPVGGHNMNGKVERKIQEVNKSLQKFINNQRLSLMQWETLSAVIANTINDLPICVGSKTDVENLDLITPNRLLLGRNNERSPVGDMIMTSDPSKLMRENKAIFNAWFESWLLNHVPQLMNQTKWFKNDHKIQVGDVVLFKKHDSSLSKTYQFGVVSKVEFSKDGVSRKVMVRYCNSTENTCRETFRSVRELVLIRSVDEFDLLEELAQKCK